MADWLWQVTDRAFNPLGELEAKDRKLSLGLNKLKTASFRIRLDNPVAEEITNSFGYVKVYREGELVFYGPIITAQQVGEGDAGSVVVNASGPEWIFSQRLVGKTAEGLKIVAGTESSIIFKGLLEAVDAANETHISTVETTISGGTTAGYESTPYKLLSEVLADLTNTSLGFDWVCEPMDNYYEGKATTPKIARFRAESAINIYRENVIFEWGTGTFNVAKFTHTVDRTTMLNRAINVGSAGPEAPGSPTKSFEDVPSIEQWGLQEGIVSTSILNEDMRQKLVEENVEVRKRPRQTITFDPVSDDNPTVPVVTQDYSIGDSVQFRTKYFEPVVMRVWAVDFTIDDNNKETQTLTLSNDGL